MNFTQGSLAVRTIMVLVWLMALAFFFFSPTLLQFVRSDKAITLLMWPAMVDVKKLHDFERETGIKVNVTYYESSEELLRKMQITKGVGYDLVIAADHAIEQLVADRLIKQLNKQELPFLPGLNPAFVNHYFDPHNDYSIPYYLGIYGLGIDRSHFKNGVPEGDWSLLFEKQGYRISMTDDARRAVMLAAFYLFGNDADLSDPAHLKKIEKLLIKQKKWVELYSDVRGEELLAAKSCPIALTISPDLWRMEQEFSNLSFVIPQKGSFMVLDSFIIPAQSKKEQHVYQLLRYLYSPELLKHNATHYGFCPPLASVQVSDYAIVCPTRELMGRLRFFNMKISKDALNDLWIAVMAS